MENINEWTYFTQDLPNCETYRIMKDKVWGYRKIINNITDIALKITKIDPFHPDIDVKEERAIYLSQTMQNLYKGYLQQFYPITEKVAIQASFNQNNTRIFTFKDDKDLALKILTHFINIGYQFLNRQFHSQFYVFDELKVYEIYVSIENRVNTGNTICPCCIGAGVAGARGLTGPILINDKWNVEEFLSSIKIKL